MSTFVVHSLFFGADCCFMMSRFTLCKCLPAKFPALTTGWSRYAREKSRWARAGGTSWAHQAQSIKQWQEALVCGGASVEPQVKWTGLPLLKHSKSVYKRHILHAGFTAHTNAALDANVIAGKLPSNICNSISYETLSSGLSAVTRSKTQPTQMPTAASQTHKETHACPDQWPWTNRRSANRKQEVRRDAGWRSLRASWVSSQIWELFFCCAHKRWMKKKNNYRATFGVSIEAFYALEVVMDARRRHDIPEINLLHPVSRR